MNRKGVDDSWVSVLSMVSFVVSNKLLDAVAVVVVPRDRLGGRLFPTKGVESMGSNKLSL